VWFILVCFRVQDVGLVLIVLWAALLVDLGGIASLVRVVVRRAP